MSTNEDNIPAVEGQMPTVSPSNYSPVTVTVKETLGALFLGILAGILLIGWVRAEARYRALITQWEKTNGNHPLNG